MSSQPDDNRFSAILEFLQGAEQLKDTLRSGVTSRGRQESTAEHSWRLCLMVMLFAKEMPGVNLLHTLKLCLVHDLGEAISGDVPAPLQGADAGRHHRERDDLQSLCSPLPPDLRSEIMSLWDEYSAGITLESTMAKGFDKLETMTQHLIGQNEADFDYAFNLTYGKRYTDVQPLLRALRRLVDAQTVQRLL